MVGLCSGHVPLLLGLSSAYVQVLTSENVRALRESIITLTRTMEHIEGISGDVGGLTGDTKVKAHVRQLVEALSRIVAD